MLFAFASMLFSCGGGNVEEQVIGEWTIEEASFENIDEIVAAFSKEMGEDADEAMIEELKADLKDDMLSDIKGSKIVFNEDKTVSIDGRDGEWKLSDDKKIITATRGDEAFDFVIDKISAEVFDFTLVIKEDGIDMKVKCSCKK